ncbi:MAG: sigma-70 family RNA polymerase sigma factor [Deltaproteobacteria bacterium]|nr:sigma-70 family RNA polymerase sigma factor [Deltaproteobacteria bacterium]
MGEETQSRAEWVSGALERYEQPLIRYACRYTGDMELARDVVQDTFLKLCKADRAKIERGLAGWLYTVCRNRALDVRKKEGRMGLIKDAQAVADPDESARPSSVAARRQEHAMVLEALESLPGDQQEAFRLKFQDHLTYREIGQVMGKSLGTVSRLLTKALESIRGQLRVGMDLAQETQS